MNDITDSLRQRHGLGLTRDRLAAATGVSAGSVSHVLERALAAGLSWPLSDGLDDDALRARLYPPPARDSGHAQPDRDAVAKELNAPRKRCHARLTRRQLWKEYPNEALARGKAAYSYSRFCARLKARLKGGGGKTQMRFVCTPGLWGLSDFSGKTLGLRIGRGEKDVEIFVTVLAHSDIIYAEAVPDQSVRHSTMAHRRALEYSGGVPERWVVDNLKAGVDKPDREEALDEQSDPANIEQPGIDDRLAMMLERKAEHREHKSYLGHLRQAQLRIRADVQDVDCRVGRGIARTTLTQLATGDWIRQALNLIVGGATRSGKTFVVCALAHQACRQRRSVLYRRVPQLVTALVRARDKGTHARLMGRLARVDLRVLDWGRQGFSVEGRRDLLEIVEARHQRMSIGEPTVAEAVLDRIVHNTCRIDLKGVSRRKRNRAPPLDDGNDK